MALKRDGNDCIGLQRLLERSLLLNQFQVAEGDHPPLYVRGRVDRQPTTLTLHLRSRSRRRLFTSLATRMGWEVAGK